MATYYAAWYHMQRCLKQITTVVERFPCPGETSSMGDSFFPFDLRDGKPPQIRISRPLFRDPFAANDARPRLLPGWLWYYSIVTIDESIKAMNEILHS